MKEVCKKKYKDLTGEKFGRLTVIKECEEFDTNYKVPQRQWQCKCDCGNIINVAGRALKEGHKKSCGCYQYVSKKMSDTRFYRIWFGMKDRCNRKNSQAYKYYGGINISYCERWENFNNFYEDMFDTYREDLTLDRIDTTKGYSKENCRWANVKQQVRNRRITKMVKYKGEEIPLAELAEKYNINYNTLYHRIFVHKWDIEEALTRSTIRDYKKR